jgi:HK97 family phage prohead protease
MQDSNEMHYRAWPVDLQIREAADGLTVSGIVVPYGVEAEIEELRPDGVISYREAFAPGAFARAQRAPNRVTLTYNHDISLGNRMGFGRSFVDTAEGLLGTFRLDQSSADKARDILQSSHASFSVGFYSLVPKAGSERAGSLVTRRSTILDHVAAVVEGAYKGAGVASIRGAELELGEPTNADLEAAAQTRQDTELLAWIEQAAADQARWDALQS